MENEKNSSEDMKNEMSEFKICSEMLPEVARWNVGQQYYIVAKVKMTGKELCEDNESMIHGEFDIEYIKELGNTPIDEKSMKDKEYSDLVVKAKSSIY